MDLMGKREVRAPLKEWLTRLEVVTILEISETLLDDMIRDGRFPQGVAWTGKERRWKWSDLVWWELQLEVAVRIAEPPARRRAGGDSPG